jgi:hypothetical protein
MRFHSPAPWEEPTTEKSVQEHSYFGKMRGIGFVSPRLGISSRPSDESTRSQGRPSKSSDTSSSQSSGRDGALRYVHIICFFFIVLISFSFLSLSLPACTSTDRWLTPIAAAKNPSIY